ncbi:hypothetical protein BABINDRAFT_160699 [Babjeviella inositovora NRRL Y-12698]|uniref:Uncharacterized protein n=1 Tax=Babjeviella inositovora NRRL Y-12698 TaxID=984486 RepID=A0A1E3QUK7_9ASCO|nr:uncharacterized protein BABINDRAFT_160699 [Babjeviella inositovora NRRL Y-12698]ODQ81340.1 hypothetical protein BABINDRAFT_160699 [Babjeviella inositovora NRRL Y-12698]
MNLSNFVNVTLLQHLLERGSVIFVPSQTRKKNLSYSLFSIESCFGFVQALPILYKVAFVRNTCRVHNLS